MFILPISDFWIFTSAPIPSSLSSVGRPIIKFVEKNKVTLMRSRWYFGNCIKELNVPFPDFSDYIWQQILNVWFQDLFDYISEIGDPGLDEATSHKFFCQVFNLVFWTDPWTLQSPKNVNFDIFIIFQIASKLWPMAGSACCDQLEGQKRGAQASVQSLFPSFIINENSSYSYSLTLSSSCRSSGTSRTRTSWWT